MAVTELSTLREAIGRAMLRDQHTFRARLRGIDNGVSHGRNLDRQLASLTYDVEASVSRREVITYDGSATAKVEITENGTTRNCTRPLPRGQLSCSE